MSHHVDYYAALGVAPDASQETVDAAVRKLKDELRGAPDAEDRLEAVEAAYEVLGDERQRAAYDAHRSPAVRPPAPREPSEPRASRRSRRSIPLADDSPAEDEQTTIPAPTPAGPPKEQPHRSGKEPSPSPPHLDRRPAAFTLSAAPAPAAAVDAETDAVSWLYRRWRPSFTPWLPEIEVRYLLLGAILLAAVLTRFVRLWIPGDIYWDEIHFVENSAKFIYRWDPQAWEWFTQAGDFRENTHPPLSKLLMAAGMVPFGETPFGWRFFGALAGVGSVGFIYLLGRKLFSEVAGLAAALLLTVEGLVFAQSRIATPDTFVLFFVLGSVYFLVSERFLWSGVFFGLGVASKWIAALTIFPILFYFTWRFVTTWLDSPKDERLRQVELLLAGGVGVLAVGGGLAVVLRDDFILAVFSLLQGDPTGDLAIPGVPILLGALIIAGAIVMLVSQAQLWRTDRGRLYLEHALIFPLFFVIVPFYVYLLTYVPMLVNGHAEGFLGLERVWDLNTRAYEFHSRLQEGHTSASAWYQWPIMGRPIFTYSGPDNARIYSMGNPAVFWAVMPAVGFALWQGLRSVRARLDQAAGGISVWGSIGLRESALLFVVLTYLAFWLPWTTQPRVLFLYHYLPALAFGILALSYGIHWLWHRPDGRGRIAAAGFLALAVVVFAYFYPHLAAVPVPDWLHNSYYWFPTDWVPDSIMNWR